MLKSEVRLPEDKAVQEALQKETALEVLQKMYELDATDPGKEKVVEGESKYRKRRFFGKVLLSFSFLKPFIDDAQLRNKIDQVLADWTRKDFTRRSRPTYKEDIEKADRLILEVLKYFKIEV